MGNFERVQSQLKEMYEDGVFQYKSTTLDRHTASSIVNGGGGQTHSLCVLCDEIDVEINLVYKPKSKGNERQNQQK